MAAQIEREMGSKPIDALGFVSALKDSPGCYVDWQTDSLHRLYSVIDQFNDWGGGRGCNIFVPVLGGNGTKTAPTGDIFDQPPGQMR